MVGQIVSIMERMRAVIKLFYEAISRFGIVFAD
jgi:hypothetical protein